ncbi:MAG: general secretion pathway protein GspK [Sedimentisphaerales bacterium]|nr:general secretion pathway protein GspK [Sedimentisphaerales bacterium]
MKLKTVKTREKGFIIVLVLCTVIMLSVLLFGFNRASRDNLVVADRFKNSARALNCARTGLSIAIASLKNAGALHSDNLMTVLDGRTNIDLADGTCSITVNQESSKLNLNLLKDRMGRPDRTRIDQFLALIDAVNRAGLADPLLGYEIVPAIIDWIDVDDETICLPFVSKGNLGAESDYYAALSSPYRPKNGPLDTIEELLLVKAVTPAVFERIRDYVTVYGDGMININHAPQLVIESLSEDMDPVLAAMIVKRRSEKPFESLSELRDIPGMTDAVYQSLRRTVTTRPISEYYRVISCGCAGGLDCTISATIQRNEAAGSIDVILYEELSPQYCESVHRTTSYRRQHND